MSFLFFHAQEHLSLNSSMARCCTIARKTCLQMSVRWQWCTLFLRRRTHYNGTHNRTGLLIEKSEYAARRGAIARRRVEPFGRSQGSATLQAFSGVFLNAYAATHATNGMHRPISNQRHQACLACAVRQMCASPADATVYTDDQSSSRASFLTVP